MKTTPLLLLALCAACKSTGSITVDDSSDPSSDDSASDDSASDDSNPPVDTGNPAEGDYALTLTLIDAERGQQIGSGEASVSIAEDGGLSGAGVCTFEQGPGAGSSADITFEGAADAAGAITGNTTTSLVIFNETIAINSDLSGSVAPPEMSLSWTVSMGGGPNGGGPSFDGAASTSP